MKKTSFVVFPFVLTFILSLNVFAQSPASPSITTLFSFPCQSFVCPDGYFADDLIESADGNFYGTATGGGTGLNSQGTVFKITPSGQISVIYSFAEESNGELPNGSAPTALIEGTDGFLYGVTEVNGIDGFGTFFKLSKSGNIQVLHNFCSTPNCTDGANPDSFIQANDGNFYGVTGPTLPPTSVLYRLTPSGKYTVLHVFDKNQRSDGTGAFGLIQATDGNLYGTTLAGEFNTNFNTVFRFSTKGVYTILHSFDETNAAASPLIQASNGSLYGLQVNSELYEISTDGKYQLIGPLSTTQYLDGNILQASDGNLWGDFAGGDCTGGLGIVFASTLTGSVLQNLPFDCATTGEQPLAMLQAANGNFYGVTAGSGGVQGVPLNGTVFTLNAGLPAPAPVFVSFTPASGEVGTKVLLQGSHFTGTTAVTFNGVSATFQVLSTNYIRATVPSGATTGPIAITNAGGTTKSVKNFTVQ